MNSWLENHYCSPDQITNPIIFPKEKIQIVQTHVTQKDGSKVADVSPKKEISIEEGKKYNIADLANTLDIWREGIQGRKHTKKEKEVKKSKASQRWVQALHKIQDSHEGQAKPETTDMYLPEIPPQKSREEKPQSKF